MLDDEKSFHIGDTEIAINPQRNERDTLHENAVFWGAIIGFVIGAVTWLFQAPKRGLFRSDNVGKELRERLDGGDAVAESIATGKAIAQERRRSRTKSNSSA